LPLKTDIQVVVQEEAQTSNLQSIAQKDGFVPEVSFLISSLGDKAVHLVAGRVITMNLGLCSPTATY